MLLKNLLNGSRKGGDTKPVAGARQLAAPGAKVSLGLPPQAPGVARDMPSAHSDSGATPTGKVEESDLVASTEVARQAEGEGNVVSLREVRAQAFARQETSAPQGIKPADGETQRDLPASAKPVQSPVTAARQVESAGKDQPKESPPPAQIASGKPAIGSSAKAQPGGANLRIDAGGQSTASGPAQLTRPEQLPTRMEVVSGELGKYQIVHTMRKEIAVVQDLDTGHFIVVVSAKQYQGAFHQGLLSRIRESGDNVQREYQADPGLITSIYSSAASKQGEQSNSAQVRDIDNLIQVALERKASDIHLTIREGDAEIRLRCNGKLVELTRWDAKYAQEIARTMHFLADADTKPQVFSTSEGQSMMISRDLGDAKVKLRVQTSNIYPNGLEVVARMLRSGRNTKPVPFENLGYSPWHIQTLNEMMRLPWGVTILAGETGSGKSTTLFTMMTSMAEADPGAKLITVEDPPEYNMEAWKITQIPVTRRRGQQEERSPFTEALRNLMRMDPDVAMVGEIRDEASAEAMVNLNRSGHKITTTIHAPNAFGIFDRLVTLGVDLPTLTSRGFISGFVSQRLVPTLCPHCKSDYKPDIDLKIPGIHERIKSVTTEGDTLYVAGDGCDHCNGTGISGQTVLAEMLIPDGRLLEMLRQGSFAQAYDYWRSHRQPRFADINRPMVGMTMADHGVLKMRMGLIAPDELELSVGPMNQGIDSETEAVVANEVSSLLKI